VRKGGFFFFVLFFCRLEGVVFFCGCGTYLSLVLNEELHTFDKGSSSFGADGGKAREGKVLHGVEDVRFLLRKHWGVGRRGRCVGNFGGG